MYVTSLMVAKTTRKGSVFTAHSIRIAGYRIRHLEFKINVLERYSSALLCYTKLTNALLKMQYCRL